MLRATGHARMVSYQHLQCNAHPIHFEWGSDQIQRALRLATRGTWKSCNFTLGPISSRFSDQTHFQLRLHLTRCLRTLRAGLQSSSSATSGGRARRARRALVRASCAGVAGAPEGCRFAAAGPNNVGQWKGTSLSCACEALPYQTFSCLLPQSGNPAHELARGAAGAAQMIFYWMSKWVATSGMLSFCRLITI